MNILFILMVKRTKLLILFAFLILLALLGSIFAYPTYALKKNEFVCRRMGGMYKAFSNEIDSCNPIDSGASAKKVLPGKEILMPDGRIIKLNKEKNGVINGYVINEGEKTEERLSLFVDKAQATFFSSIFLVPFSTTTGEQSTMHLGAFSYTDLKNLGLNNTFYNQVYFLYSYDLGSKVEIDEIKQSGHGSYSYPIILTVHNIDTPDEKEMISLRYYDELGRLVEDPGCEVLAQVVSRKKGDNSLYKVCVYEDGNECSVNAYNDGKCPFGGFDVSEVSNEVTKYGIINGHFFDGIRFIFPSTYENCTIDEIYNGLCKNALY